MRSFFAHGVAPLFAVPDFAWQIVATFFVHDVRVTFRSQ
jgi:hypothetical protein